MTNPIPPVPADVPIGVVRALLKANTELLANAAPGTAWYANLQNHQARLEERVASEPK